MGLAAMVLVLYLVVLGHGGGQALYFQLSAFSVKSSV
jgi:hypothetical protein